MSKAEDMLKRISEQWFLREPAYFALYCVQRLEPNTNMKCTLRVGQGRLEYHPEQLGELTFNEAEQLMRIEMIRLFLKHPYERQPDGVSRAALALGSDVTISDNYNRGYHREELPLLKPKDFKLEIQQSYEWYAKKIDEQLVAGDGEEGDDEATTGGENPTEQQKLRDEAKEKAELWQEDGLKVQEINDLIKSLSNWGTLPGNLVETIEASTQAKIDYRLIFQGFRGSILSSRRRLTRMKPNRRTGFDQMGSTRHFSTRLLVAVDVSGSITSEQLTHFYSVINKMFKYGIEQIDCVQFDTELGPVRNLRKAKKEVEVTGRGGTDFQPIFDYLRDHNIYDGLIILTDGEAAIPKKDPSIHTDILWVCDSEASYNASKRWMELIGRCCWMIL